MALSLGFAPVPAFGTGTQTISITPANVGDVVVCSTEVSSTGITCTGVSSSNVKWNSTASFTYTGDGTNTIQLWIGVATSTSNASISFTWSGSVSALGVECSAMSVHSSIACNWQMVLGASGGNTGTTVSNGDSLNMPSLTSGSNDLGEFYFGFESDSNNVNAGSTSGFVYNADGNGNGQVYGLNLAATTAFSPNWISPVVATYTGVAFIVQARSGLPNPVIVTQAVKMASSF